jgi:hypothetical protein
LPPAGATVNQAALTLQRIARPRNVEAPPRIELVALGGGALMGDYKLTARSLKLRAGLFLRGWRPANEFVQNDRVLAALRRARRQGRSRGRAVDPA